MRIAALLLFCFVPGAAESAEDKTVLAAVQKLFDGMAAHDPEMIKSAMTPEARLVGARNGRPATNYSRDEFAKAVTGNTAKMLERIWDPKVQVRGQIATVWAEYDFHLNGKFNHCGIDTFLLLKTDEGWKTAALGWTTETEGCAPSPLGPPKLQ